METYSAEVKIFKFFLNVVAPTTSEWKYHEIGNKKMYIVIVSNKYFRDWWQLGVLIRKKPNLSKERVFLEDERVDTYVAN